MSEENKRPREFQHIEDPREAEQLLKEGAKTLAAAMVWTTDQKHIINTHLSLYSASQNLLYAWCPKGFDPKGFMNELAHSEDHDCYFSVSLMRANIFFKTTFHGFDTAGLQFKIPRAVYKVQRRKDLRFPVPEGYIIKVEFQDPLFPDTTIQRKVLDISAGGLSFSVPLAEEAYYTVGLQLQTVTFTVASKKITCAGEVRHVRALNEPEVNGVKIGIQFKNLKPEDNHHIAAYAFQESRKFYSRFM